MSLLQVTALARDMFGPVSFTLEKGECLAVQGPSGAGKSLLLRAVADLDPCRGAVSLDARPRDSFTGPQWRRLVGYLPAEPGWWAERVSEHVPHGAALTALMARLTLRPELLDQKVSLASTGERLRLALVRALLIDPKVLLLDEPTAALDPVAVGLVEDLIAERVAAGLAVIWVTHDPAQAERVAKRVLRIEKKAAAP